MKVPGYVAAVIGLVIALLAVVNHYVQKLPAIGGVQKGSLILGIVGVVVFAIGGYMAMQKSKAA